MLRIIYIWLVRLPPPYFRNRFADEMLSIFDLETGLLAAVNAVSDGAWSLLRQWTVRHEFWREPDFKIASETTLSFWTLDDTELPRGAWFKGMALSASLFCLFWLAIVFGQNKIPQGRPAVIQRYGLAVLSSKFDPNNFQSGANADPTQSADRSNAPLPSFFSTQPRAQRSSAPTDTSQATFEAVSIKPNKSGDNRLGIRPEPGGRFLATNVTGETLIHIAYSTLLKPIKLIGGPSWMTSEHFDIEAKAEGNASMDEMRPMLQAMLADRFKLVVHHETRQSPQYSLVLVKEAKLGPKLVLHADDAKCADISSGAPPLPRPGETPPTRCGGFAVGVAQGGSHVAAQRVTMDALVGVLTRFVDRTVVDQTGLTGVYDVDLNFTPVPSPLPPGPDVGSATGAPDSNAPPLIFTALQEQLGLKLKPGAAPADVLVIDHIEHPSGN